MHTKLTSVLTAAFAAVLLSACGPTYPKCDEDKHCADKGEVCVAGSCTQCRDDSNCEAGQQCTNGACEAKPECAVDGDCTDNKVCRSGKCQIECEAEGDCGMGMKCQQNRCVESDACTTAADCQAGTSCIGGRCQAAENASALRTMCTFPSVNFAFNESNLDPDTQSALQEVADCLKQQGGVLVIEGYCDERGTEEYNLALGDRRARAVLQYLVRLGVPEEKLRPVSKGKLDPVNPAHSEAAWAENRRAEFVQQ